jgi:hypothetical protein
MPRRAPQARPGACRFPPFGEPRVPCTPLCCSIPLLATGLIVAVESVILAAVAGNILAIGICGVTVLRATGLRGILMWRVNGLPRLRVPEESLMSRLAIRAMTLLLGLAALCAPAIAQESGLAAKLHPWGRFEPGAWKIVRVTTETLNDQDQVVSTSTTDTKTTLLEISNDGVKLEVEACMEVAGKRFRVEPQTVTEGFHGEMPGANVKLKEPVDGHVMIEDRKIPCKIRQLSLLGPNSTTNITLHYSSLPPYVLKRECVVTDAEGKKPVSETTKNVMMLDMPVRVLGELRSGSYVRTVHKNGKTIVTTVAVMVRDVPGGVVSHSSKEADKDGRLRRRSTLELLDYSADPDKDRSGMFSRKRSSRRTKTPTRYGP